MSDNPMRHHALTMASATHLHNAGHISGPMRDQIHANAKAGIAHGKVKKMAMKPMAFGSLAPGNPDEENRS
jgi:hypothetical protein